MVSFSGILLALAASAFFTSIEIAFTTANKLHIELQAGQGIYSGKILSRFVNNPSGLIGTMMIGKVLANVTYVVLAMNQFYPWLQYTVAQPPYDHVAVLLPLAILIIFMGYFVVVECLTKFVFLINANRWLRVFVIPLRILYGVLYPFIAGIAGVSRWVIRHILQVPNAHAQTVFNLTDLNSYIEEVGISEAEKEELEVDTRIFNNALLFKSIRVRECMVPRTEISAVDIADPVGDLRQAFVDSGHSKILIYRDTIDNVIGYCHALELFRKPKAIGQMLTPIKIVAETMPVTDLFIEFTKEQKSLALVVDEYGGTSGLVSLEDIVEQLFGEIQDEYDVSEDWVEEKLDKYTYLLSARHDIGYLNEKYGLNLPVGDYGTLAGLIISVYKDLPSVNDQIGLPPFTFTILSMQESYIDVVKLSVDNKGE